LVIIYIAIEADDDDYKSPIPLDFVDTGEELSVLRISKALKPRKMHLTGID